MRPGPEDPAQAEAFAVDPLRGGGQHHPVLHKGQQFEELVLGGQRGRVWEQEAREPAPDGRWREGRGRQVHYPDVSALDLTLQDLLAQITDGHFEGVLNWRVERGGGVNSWRTGFQWTFRYLQGMPGRSPQSSRPA